MEELIRSLVVPLSMFAILYLFIIRPQKKQEKKKQEMIRNIKIGDKIVTIGGIHGEVIVVKEDILIIESSTTKSRLDISKWAVASVIENK